MISVEEATARITAAFAPVSTETIALGEAFGRVLATDMRAKLAQPPFPVSSMDGYALRAEDAASPTTLRVTGESQAGHPFAGSVNAREAVRIFTGAVVPDGADAIVIQEDTEANRANVIIKVSAQRGRHIRVAGLDFKAGDVLVRAGRRLTARDLPLIAAGDIAQLDVRRRPRIAFAATGDELSRPGEARKPGGIVASSVYGLSAMITAWGGEPVDLGLLPDTVEAFTHLPQAARDCDLLITLGGASVGDRDLVRQALGPLGLELDFWKIAMRPGKPLIFGRLGNTPFLGLPGNPVSTLVCTLLFLKPAMEMMLGTSPSGTRTRARLATPLPANDSRQDYIRARLIWRDGEPWAEPFSVQDSSMLSVLAAADALIIRPPRAPAAGTGEAVEILALSNEFPR
jgi:molybdopterin molybdotransferase